MWLTVHHFLRALFGTNYRKFTRRQQVAIFRPRLEALEDRTVLSPVLGVDHPDLVVPGGNTAANTGTYSGSNVSLSASAGTLVQNTNGTWSWSEATPANVKAQAQTVTITATDDQGGSSQESFFVNSGNILTVTTTADDMDGGTAADPAGADGTLSLREAIAAANAQGGAVIAFAIPTTDPGYNSTAGAFTIQPHSALPSINKPTVIDGYSQPGATPNTLTVGDNAVLKIDLDGSNAGLVNGLNIGSNSTVEGLAVTNFGNGQQGFTAPVAIQVGGNVQIIGDFIGTDVTGTVEEGNGMGVVVYGAGNTVGGTNPAMRDVIGGNADFGVWLRTDGNAVEGSYIGTDHTGTKAFGNSIGVQDDGSNNTIGGPASGAGNVISGNGSVGIRSGNPTSEVIQDNFIGIDATGKVGLGNGLAPPPGVAPGDGIEIDSGFATITGNVISANPNGIVYNGSVAVQGNLIGTDATGKTTTGTDGKSLGNTIIGIGGNGPATIGSPTDADPDTIAADRNIISGNATGIVGGPGVVIHGNYIGTDITGRYALGNDGGPSNFPGGDNGGIEFSGGGVTIVGNLISGNGAGIDIRGEGAGGRQDGSGTVIQGNLIGTDYTGKQPLGNAVGILFQSGGSNYTIGGTTSGEGNVISGNGYGIYMFNGTAVDTGNVIEGNFIGTNAAGAKNLGNGTGVDIQGFSDTQIGGTIAAAGNVIADNGGNGVEVESGTGNSILGNSIHDNGGLGISLTSGANDNQAAPVLTSAVATASGTTINGTLTSTPGTTFHIDFFANLSPDPSGYGEGQYYLGSITVKTDANGSATFQAAGLAQIPVGYAYLSSTATVVHADNTFGDSSQFSQDIVAPPTADAGGPYSIQEGQSLTLNGSASYDPLGNPLTYAWDINGAGTFSAATGVSPTLTWAQLQALGVTDEGKFTVQLRVTDPNGSTGTSSPVALTVTDAPLSASGLTVTPTAGAPFSGVLATFTDAYAGAAAGDYSASINWGDGNVTTGTISSNGNGGFNVNGSHTYAASGPYAVSVSINDAGGSTATASSTANVASLGQTVQKGEGPGVGFWHNSNGQALIDAFNGGSSSTVLSTWLSSTFPNLYGVNAGANNLTGKTNAQVAAFDLLLFNESGMKLDAQVLATALNVYATTLALGGTTGQSYGFLVDAYGLGARSYNVGSNGAAFGVPNNTTLNVYQILLAANQQAVNGVLYNGNATLDNEANNIFSGINQAGGI